MKAVANKIREFRWLLVALALVPAIGLQVGCGQKGDLYYADEVKPPPAETKKETAEETAEEE
uniref:Lipoprotein-attachment site-containing protein n=1 Tax=Candidatus Kentrum sp. SD TaxID=2126332 RepID=A0A450Z1Y6_9GAMM|nr:MAG: hypothetical protein BECKSD772F_GA0070984_11534 [Candidatus Kentron sp. SD]VFK47810.1 MAG: hypothetical protein BECKSD772E_GA0070983_11068 [Candidatus Kentron sp. SD]